MGEQHPITTLREFVEPITEYYKKNKLDNDEDIFFWESPDNETGNFDSRKMTMKGKKKIIKTDFFEFYWAHHMNNTSWGHIKDWIFNIMLRLPTQRLFLPFIFFWIIIVILILLLLFIIIKQHEFIIKNLTEIILILLLIVLLLKVITNAITQNFFYDILGDAGRYINPSPKNISNQIAIRKAGFKLLKKISESGKYSRIVLIGHSLGSVIAYDLIKLLWIEYCESYDPTKVATLFKNKNTKILRDVYCSDEAGKKVDGTNDNLYVFRNAQNKSFNYLNLIGNKWLITDLVTIASPLTHIDHIFIGKKDLFEKIKKQTEYPTCPPEKHVAISNIIKSRIIKVPEVVNPLNIPHFSYLSPFLATKWTNFYYSFDYLGGPLKDKFGKGLKDVEIKNKNWFFMRMYPKGHTDYWNIKYPFNILDKLWSIIKN
jgi:hypothetical protein